MCFGHYVDQSVEFNLTKKKKQERLELYANILYNTGSRTNYSSLFSCLLLIRTNSERVIALRIVATVTLLFICYPPLVPLATIGQTLLRGQRRNGKNNIIKPKKLIFAVSSAAKL